MSGSDLNFISWKKKKEVITSKLEPKRAKEQCRSRQVNISAETGEGGTCWGESGQVFDGTSGSSKSWQSKLCVSFFFFLLLKPKADLLFKVKLFP